MSVNFVIRGWDDQPFTVVKIYFHREFPELVESYAGQSPGIEYLKDSHGYYRLEKVYSEPYPSLNTNNAVWAFIARLIGLNPAKYEEGDSIEVSELPEFQRAVIKAINTHFTGTETKVAKNFIDAGMSRERILRVLHALSNIALFAQRKQSPIDWY